MIAHWIQEELERAGARFETVKHHRAITAQALAKAEHFSGRRVAKAVVVVADEKPVLLVLPASRRIAWPNLQATLKAKAMRLADELEMARWFSDCELGAEPPLRHWPGVDLWMDESLRTDGEILFSGGTHLDGIRMRFEDWFRVAPPHCRPPLIPEGRRAILRKGLP